MAFIYDPHWAYALLLCGIRFSTLLTMAPFLGGFSIPARIRLLLVLMLTVAMTANRAAIWPAPPAEIAALLVATGAEVVNGALLAFGIFAAFAAFSIAGKLLDIQIGFGVGSVFDPVTRRQSGVLAPMLDLFAVVVFFASGLYQTLVRGMAQTLDQLPLGSSLMPSEPTAVIRQFGVMFSQGLLLAAPVAACLLLLDIGLAVLSRNIPQLNIFVISMPIKVLVGLAMLTVSVQYLVPTINQTLRSIFSYWLALTS